MLRHIVRLHLGERVFNIAVIRWMMHWPIEHSMRTLRMLGFRWSCHTVLLVSFYGLRKQSFCRALFPLHESQHRL